MVKVSVIVPVYNVEQYLPSCLDCLVQQTLQDIEVIVVNDGSPDRSQQIIDEYTAKYPEKIKGFIKPNGGLSDARNYGLQYAVGEYVTFLDSDDQLTETACEKMYQAAKKNNSDIVCAKSAWLYSDGVIKEVEYLLKWYQYEGDNLRNNSSFPTGFPIATSKLFKRELIEKNNLRFPTGITGEDVVFSTYTYYYSKRIDIINELVYLRTERVDSNNPSITQQASLKIVQDRIKVIQLVSDFCTERDLYDIEKKVIFTQIDYINKIIPKIQDFIDRQQAQILLLQYKSTKSPLFWISYSIQNQKRNIKRWIHLLFD